MALDIRISTNFFQNFKIKKLIRRCGLEGAQSIMQLWFYAREERPDGVLTGMDLEDLELAADWNGKPGDFGKAICEIGLIDQTESGYTIHDWDQHNPFSASAEKRIASAKKAAAVRWDRNGNADSCEPNAKRMRVACEPNAECNPHNTTQHNTTNEVQDRGANGSADASPSDTRILSLVVNPTEQEEPRQKTKRQEKKAHPQEINDSFLADLQAKECYKALQVRREWQKMVSWCEANNKSPTRKRLINWLNRSDPDLRKTRGYPIPPATPQDWLAEEERMLKQAIADGFNFNDWGENAD
jgi:hypothetical protein